MTANILPTHTPIEVRRPGMAPSMPNRFTDFPQGYPRFAAFTGLHPSFLVFRRFANLRARMLLHKQDRLSVLEERLYKVDNEESKKLYLGSYRKDQNEERHAILRDLDQAMGEYDFLLKRTREIFKWSSARNRDVSNLRDWLGENGCLSRDEVAYLSQDDLVAAWDSGSDGVYQYLEAMVEDFMIWISSLLGMDLRSKHARYSNLYLFSETLINFFARVALALIPATVLLVPVFIITAVDSLKLRLIFVVTSSVFSIAILSVMSRAGIGKLFVAGATYAAVLVAYIANDNRSSGV